MDTDQLESAIHPTLPDGDTGVMQAGLEGNATLYATGNGDAYVTVTHELFITNVKQYR